MQVLNDEKLYASFSNCEFWLWEVQFPRHIVYHDGIMVDPINFEAAMKWEPPKTPIEVRKDIIVVLSRIFLRSLAPLKN